MTSLEPVPRSPTTSQESGDDLVVLARQDHVQHLRRHQRLAVGVTDHRAQDDPVAGVGAGAELPPAVEDVAAVDGLGHALRCVRRGDPGVDVVGPDLLGHPRIGVGQLVGVHADDAVDPAGRGIQRRGRHDCLGELARMHLEAAVLRGLQQTDRPDRLHALDRRVGQLADLLGFDGLLPNWSAISITRSSTRSLIVLSLLLGPVSWSTSRIAVVPRPIPVSGHESGCQNSMCTSSLTGRAWHPRMSPRRDPRVRGSRTVAMSTSAGNHALPRMSRSGPSRQEWGTSIPASSIVSTRLWSAAAIEGCAEFRPGRRRRRRRPCAAWFDVGHAASLIEVRRSSAASPDGRDDDMASVRSPGNRRGSTRATTYRVVP